MAILGPNERKGDCRPEAARIAFGPNLAPIVSPYRVGDVPGRYDTAVSNGHPRTAISNDSSGCVRHLTCGICAKVLASARRRIEGT
jgi:hypothetical protein